MDVLPSKPAPQTPMGPMKSALGVEESRAQRHQRQQSRFRDRGGFVIWFGKGYSPDTPFCRIFKPSNRNTLVDILMGRRAPSPKKLLRRSTSCSPSKRDKTPSRLDVDKTRVSCDNSAVSPTKTKTSRKTRSLVPPQATLEGRSSIWHPLLIFIHDHEENRTSHLHESQAEETAGNCPCLASPAGTNHRARQPNRWQSGEAGPQSSRTQPATRKRAGQNRNAKLLNPNQRPGENGLHPRRPNHHQRRKASWRRGHLVLKRNRCPNSQLLPKRPSGVSSPMMQWRRV